MHLYLLGWGLLCCAPLVVELSASTQPESRSSLKGNSVDLSVRPWRTYKGSSVIERKRKQRSEYYNGKQILQYVQPKVMRGGYYETSMTGLERKVADDRHVTNKKIATDEVTQDQDMTEKQVEVKPSLPEEKLEDNESTGRLENLSEETDLHTKQLSRDGSNEPIEENRDRHHYHSPLKNRDPLRNRIDYSRRDPIENFRLTPKSSMVSKMWRRYLPGQRRKFGSSRHHVSVSLVGLDDFPDEQVDPSFDQRMVFRRPVHADNRKFAQGGQFKVDEEEEPEDGEYNQVLSRSNKNNEFSRVQSIESDCSCKCRGCGVRSSHCGGGINISILLPNMPAISACQVRSSTSSPKSASKGGKKGKKRKERRQIESSSANQIQITSPRKLELKGRSRFRNNFIAAEKPESPEGGSTVKTSSSGTEFANGYISRAQSNKLPPRLPKVVKGSLGLADELIARSEGVVRCEGPFFGGRSERTLTVKFTTPAAKRSSLAGIVPFPDEKKSANIDKVDRPTNDHSHDTLEPSLRNVGSVGIGKINQQKDVKQSEKHRKGARESGIGETGIIGGLVFQPNEPYLQPDKADSHDQWTALDVDLNNDLLERQRRETQENYRTRKREADYDERLDQLEGYYQLTSGKIPENMIVSAFRRGKGKYNYETIASTKSELTKEASPQEPKLPDIPNDVDRKSG